MALLNTYTIKDYISNIESDDCPGYSDSSPGPTVFLYFLTGRNTWQPSLERACNSEEGTNDHLSSFKLWLDIRQGREKA